MGNEKGTAPINSSISRKSSYVIFFEAMIDGVGAEKTKASRTKNKRSLSYFKDPLRASLRFDGRNSPIHMVGIEKFFQDYRGEELPGATVIVERIAGFPAAICYGLTDEDAARLENSGLAVFPADEEMEVCVAITSHDGEKIEIANRNDDKCWHLKHTNTVSLPASRIPPRKVTVGLLDTGVQSDHPEFSRSTNVVALEASGDPAVVREVIPVDTDGHGTATASLISGNNVGICPGTTVVVGNVFTRKDGKSINKYYFRPKHLTKILERMVVGGGSHSPVDLVSISFGALEDCDANNVAEFLMRISNALYGKGLLIVSSTGNDGQLSGPCRTPGREHITDVLGVGATDRTRQRAEFSNCGPRRGSFDPKDNNPNISAPGVEIPVAARDQGHKSRSGTSFSTAIVAGLAARAIVEGRGSRNGAALTDLLMDSADPTNSCFKCGAGVAALPP